MKAGTLTWRCDAYSEILEREGLYAEPSPPRGVVCALFLAGLGHKFRSGFSGGLLLLLRRRLECHSDHPPFGDPGRTPGLDSAERVPQGVCVCVCARARFHFIYRLLVWLLIFALSFSPLSHQPLGPRQTSLIIRRHPGGGVKIAGMLGCPFARVRRKKRTDHMGALFFLFCRFNGLA